MTPVEEIIAKIQSISDPTDRANALAYELQGTANSMPEVFIDDTPLLAELDQLIFRCDCCSWWCEQGECNENPDGGDDICNDCLDE